MPGIRVFTHEELAFLSTALLTKKVTMDATALDAGNTGQTHILRAGLAVAEIGTTDTFAHYASGASDGTETGDYILLDEVDLKGGDAGAASADVPGAVVLVIGSVVSGKVLLQDPALILDLAKGGGGLGWIEFV